MGRGAYGKARAVLAQYGDQSFSFVDAVIFAIVDDDPGIRKILTVDGRDFSIYRFAHAVEVVAPSIVTVGMDRAPDVLGSRGFAGLTPRL